MAFLRARTGRVLGAIVRRQKLFGSNYRLFSMTTTEDLKFDLVVIGAGSGGMATARRAAQHGAKVINCPNVLACFHYLVVHARHVHSCTGGYC